MPRAAGLQDVRVCLRGGGEGRGELSIRPRDAERKRGTASRLLPQFVRVSFRFERAPDAIFFKPQPRRHEFADVDERETGYWLRTKELSAVFRRHRECQLEVLSVTQRVLQRRTAVCHRPGGI